MKNKSVTCHLSPIPSVKSLAWSAFSCGSLRAIQYKRSDRSPSRASFAAHFTDHRRAQRFAQRVSGAGQQVTVKKSPLGFVVTVPAPRPYSRMPASADRMLPVRGGIRGLARLLLSSGLGGVL